MKQEVFIGKNHGINNWSGYIVPAKIIDHPCGALINILRAKNSADAYRAAASNRLHARGSGSADFHTMSELRITYPNCDLISFDDHYDNRPEGGGFAYWTRDINNFYSPESLEKFLWSTGILKADNETICNFARWIDLPYSPEIPGNENDPLNRNFESLMLNPAIECSMYNRSCQADLLGEICLIEALNENQYFRVETWTEEADRLGYETVHKGAADITEELLEINSTLPAQTVLAALQCEADRRIKKSVPSYNPLENADESSVSLDGFTLINALAMANHRTKGYRIIGPGNYQAKCTTQNENVKVTITAEEISALADQAKICFRNNEITQDLPRRSRTKQQI